MGVSAGGVYSFTYELLLIKSSTKKRNVWKNYYRNLGSNVISKSKEFILKATFL